MSEPDPPQVPAEAVESDPEWPPETEWYEAWDHHTHGFRQFGELTAVALCGRVSAKSSLHDPPTYARWCGACLLIEEPARGA